MNKTIHVLNGDSTFFNFKQANIEGNVLIWRELLCEGQLDKDVGSDSFWKKRYDFFENEWGTDKLSYFDKTIREIVQLEDIPIGNDVVLWFEYDLFCQINMLAACSYLLKKFRKDLSYYLVCTGTAPGKKELQLLSDYPPEAYKTLYENKVKLTKNNLLFAEQCWQVYERNNLEELRSFNFGECSKFQYLEAAIGQHIQRFPDAHGLNQIDRKVLNIIKLSAFTSEEIIRELLFWQQAETVYGFGDLQYKSYLKKLNNCYSVKDRKYYLNEMGTLKMTNYGTN